MTSRHDLINELAGHPIGPVVAEAKVPFDDIRTEVSITGTTAYLEVRDKEGATKPDTALVYLEEEGQDPDDWEVTGFKKIKYGLGMESVKFTFKRVYTAGVGESVTISTETIDRWRQDLLLADLTPSEPSGGGTYTILIADPQFGKKGTEEAVANYKRGVLAHVAQAKAVGVEGVHVAWMGDETENVVNSYGNQPHTIELNRSQQLELDYDMRVWALKQALTVGVPVSGSSVISNHGEWTRNGGKDVVTTQGDNSSTYVARQVKALFDELAPHTGNYVDWTIGGGEPGVTIELSGVPCYFSHGYIEKGKGGSTEIRTKAAIERQILGKTDELGFVVLWFMAHYHHFYSNEFEGRSLFGCPALEAEKSSEYMLDQYGVWSPPGMLGLVVTDRLSRGWSDLNVF